MSKEAHAEMTNVKGYFNPNSYRVTVMISEVGLAVELAPQEFILERTSLRKINDPILNRYVGRLLSVETTDKPVPVIKIPVVTHPVPANPGYVVGQGKRDATGRWQPPIAASAPPVPATSASGAPVVSSQGSVMGMTIDEARKRGFIGKQRLVSEDYGAAETDGAPTRGDAIPKIKYSMETVAPMARHSGPLPAELAEGIRPEMAGIIQGLSKAAQADPESVNLGKAAAEKAVREQQGEQGVQAFRQTAKAIKQTAKAAVATVAKAVKPAVAVKPAPKPVVAEPVPPPAPPAPSPIVAAPAPAAPAIAKARRVVAEVLPPAPVEELEEAEVTTDSPLTGGRPPELPSPQVEEPEEPKAKGEKKETIVCPACNKPFPFKSYFIRHAQRAHKDKLQELMQFAAAN